MRARLRRLHLDGREFVWRAEVRRDGGRRVIRVRVWGAEAGKNGRALQADLRPRGDVEEYPFPSAEDVRVLIAYGKGSGWDPSVSGGTQLVPAAAPVRLAELVVVSS